MARKNGKLILFSDFHAAMPEAELRRRRELMDEALESAADDPDKIVVLTGDTMEGPFIPDGEARGAAIVDAAIASLASKVADGLGFFLEMIDQCDVLFLDRVGDRLVFMVCADREENLPLIRNAIAGEHRLLDSLGIDTHDVEVERSAIKVVARIPDPAADGLAS